jgi:hypothetical protein
MSRTNNLFIRGPIPFDWLMRANNIGGKAGLVGNALWLYVGLKKSLAFKIDGKLDLLCGISRQARQSNLKKLEENGLIKFTNRSGCYPQIEIIKSTPSLET